MAKKRKASAKKSTKKASSTKSSSNPKFGSPAWFAKYPKAARVKGGMKAKKKGKKGK